jgi:uncharacterized protein DUF1236
MLRASIRGAWKLPWFTGSVNFWIQHLLEVHAGSSDPKSTAMGEIGDACGGIGFPAPTKIAQNCHECGGAFCGTMASAPNWEVVPVRAGPRKEGVRSMRNHLIVAAVMAAVVTPVAAQAQSYTTGAARSVVVDEDAGIAVEQRPAFREYVIRERVPNYVVPDRVVVGGVLPESGVTYYDVPQTYGATPYRYTVVNGETVLVEPRSRRIVQVVE